MNANTNYKVQKTLELTIRINGSDFEVDVYEPESGDFARMQHPYSSDEHPEFDKAIGDEIYSWLDLWDEEADETTGLGTIRTFNGKTAEELWNALGDVPMNPETECIEELWCDFPPGTHREEIWHWFEETFGVSVHSLMYP